VARQLVRGMPTMAWSRAVLLGLAVTILAGCNSVPIPPTYTQDELKAICERTNGWWHTDDLIGGECERR
jgi:hypothetical protein